MSNKEVIEKLEERQEKQKRYYDKRTKERKDFEIQDKVRVQMQDKTWTPGIIVNKMNKPRTYRVKLNNGTILERNKKYLIKDTDKKKQNKMQCSNPKNQTIDIKVKRQIVQPKRLNDYICN